MAEVRATARGIGGLWLTGRAVVRRALVALTAVVLSVLAPPLAAEMPALPAPPSRLPAPERAFFAGSALFNHAFTPAEGLGPSFAARSCAACHAFGGRARDPQGPGLVLRRLDPTGIGVATLPRFQVGPDGAISMLPAPQIRWAEERVVLADGTELHLRRPQLPAATPPLVLRVSPQLLGTGLLAAVPDGALEALADPDDADGDGVSGRPALVRRPDGGRALGRFGWKAEKADLRHQLARALWDDMGLATALVSSAGGAAELDDAALDLLVAYVAARPAALPPEPLPAAGAGAELFRRLGCAACHVPELPVEGGMPIAAFTDLLLHDLGPGLADPAPTTTASAGEWRTAPLWRLRLALDAEGRGLLLHDGRARTLDEAILWHGGEAAPAAEAWRRLPAGARAALNAWLLTL